MPETQVHPWKNGCWYNYSQKCLFNIVQNGNFEMHTTNYLDYPNMEPKYRGTWTYGKYEEVTPEIFAITKIKNYNLKIDSGRFKQFGVLDETGTCIHFLGLSNAI